MKFKSRTDLLHNFIVFGTVIFLVAIIILVCSDFSIGIAEKIWISFLLLLVSGYMLWIRFGTAYEITDEFLNYKTGPIQGKIKISTIKTLEAGKTLWAGMKPATALNGIIVKYNKYDEIYISPENNKAFAEEILKLNPEVTVNYH